MGQKLEKLGYILLGAIIALGGYFLGSMNNNEESESSILDKVVCRRLEIVDLQDKTVAVLGKEAEDSTKGPLSTSVFRVYNTGAEEIISLGESLEAGSMVLATEGGKTVVHLGEAKGAGWISTHGSNGKMATLLTTINGAGLVTVMDTHSDRLAKYGYSSAILSGKDKTVRAALIDDDEGGSIFLKNRYGKTVIYLGATNSGGYITLKDSSSETRVGLSSHDFDGGFMRLMNRSGRIVTSLPR